jgi:hypothetical protein
VRQGRENPASRSGGLHRVNAHTGPDPDTVDDDQLWPHQLRALLPDVDGTQPPDNTSVVRGGGRRGRGRRAAMVGSATLAVALVAAGAVVLHPAGATANPGWTTVPSGSTTSVGRPPVRSPVVVLAPGQSIEVARGTYLWLTGSGYCVGPAWVVGRPGAQACASVHDGSMLPATASVRREDRFRNVEVVSGLCSEADTVGITLGQEGSGGSNHDSVTAPGSTLVATIVERPGRPGWVAFYSTLVVHGAGNPPGSPPTQTGPFSVSISGP